MKYLLTLIACALVVVSLMFIIIISNNHRITELEERTQFLFEQCEDHFCGDEEDYSSELYHCE